MALNNDLSKYIMDNYYSDNQKATINIDELLVNSVLNKDVEGIKKAISDGANLNYRDNYTFISAVRNGDLEIVKLLINFGAKIYNRKKKDIAFIVCCQEGHLEVLEYLLSLEIIKDLNYEFLALCAAEYKQNEIVKYFIKENKVKHNFDKSSLIKVAASNGNMSLFTYLESCGEDLFMDNGLLLAFAARAKDFELIKYLISNGENLSEKVFSNIEAKIKDSVPKEDFQMIYDLLLLAKDTKRKKVDNKKLRI